MNLTRENLGQAVKAAYDIRSKYLHTGDTTGFGHLARNEQNAEIQLGTPVIEDKKLKKILTNAPTLPGLERLVSTLLRSEIARWISEINAVEAKEAELAANESEEITVVQEPTVSGDKMKDVIGKS